MRHTSTAGYRRWLIAKGNVLLPAAVTVAKLVEQLRTEGWIPASGHAVRTIENTFGADAAAKEVARVEPQPSTMTAEWLDDPEREELRLVWPVTGDEAPPVKYPLSRRPEGAHSWAIEIHRALEYVYPSAKTIGTLETTCRCGEDLSFEWDEDELVPAFESASGIFAECDECSRTFDPSKSTAAVKDPFSGSSEELPGGAAYRFALLVHCREGFAEDPTQRFAPELVALLEKAFGRSFYEVAVVAKGKAS